MKNNKLKNLIKKALIEAEKTKQEAASGKCKYKCENGHVETGNCCSDGTACEGNRIKVCAGKRFKTKNESKKYTKRGLVEFIKSTINPLSEQNWTQNMWSTGNYSDYLNWYENFYNNVLNRNNPCNFLQNQINNWTTSSQNTNPNSPTAASWMGQMSSKINGAKEICCDLGCPCC